MKPQKSNRKEHASPANHTTEISPSGSKRKFIQDQEQENSMKRPRKYANFNLCNSQTRPAPFSFDVEAKQIRDNCDYTIKVTMDEAKIGKAARTVRVYADGIYDMFHNGHARQLMQAKCLLPNAYLIVGVSSDEQTHSLKGRTVMDEDDRYDAIRHCRYVDEVYPGPPWTITDEFIHDNKIDFVAHDDMPYGSEGDTDIYQTFKERGMFLVTQRTEGVSTTDIIANIVKDYDMYIRRNLARGYTAKELNVSFVKEKKIKLGEKYDRLMDKGKELGKEFIDKGQEIINRWERNSKEFISNFIDVFSKDGRISTWLQDNTHRVVRAISPSSDLASPSSSPTNICLSDDNSDQEDDHNNTAT